MVNNLIENSYYAFGNNYFKNGESVFINVVEESSEPHQHCHDFIEITYIAGGEGEHIIGDNSYCVCKGDINVINYDIVHEFRSYPDKPPLIVYNCIFNPEFIDYSLINCSSFTDMAHHFLFRSLFPEEMGQQSDIRIVGKDSLNLENLFKKMLSEYEERAKGFIEILRAYTIELLVTIFRLYDNNKDFHNRNYNIRKDIIEKVLNYMKENYKNGVSLDHLSEISFYSPNYLCKLFKEVTNKTVSEYIQNIRINKACELLKNTNLTILNIAYEVGYKDIKFFGMTFKKNVGCTPSKYKKLNFK
jgi:AraC family L-rhamnose operon transcriptional activator RhaR